MPNVHVFHRALNRGETKTHTVALDSTSPPLANPIDPPLPVYLLPRGFAVFQFLRVAVLHRLRGTLYDKLHVQVVLEQPLPVPRDHLLCAAIYRQHRRGVPTKAQDAV